MTLGVLIKMDNNYVSSLDHMIAYNVYVTGFVKRGLIYCTHFPLIFVQMILHITSFVIKLRTSI